MYHRDATCGSTPVFIRCGNSTESTDYHSIEGPICEDTITVTCPPELRFILDLWKDYDEHLRRIITTAWKYRTENKKIIKLNNKVINIIVQLSRRRFCRYRRKAFKGGVIRTH